VNPLGLGIRGWYVSTGSRYRGFSVSTGAMVLGFSVSTGAMVLGFSVSTGAMVLGFYEKIKFCSQYHHSQMTKWNDPLPPPIKFIPVPALPWISQ